MAHLKDVLLGGPLWRWLASKFPDPANARMRALLLDKNQKTEPILGLLHGGPRPKVLTQSGVKLFTPPEDEK